MNTETKIITREDIARAIHAMKGKGRVDNLYWVDNEYWYQSREAEIMGFKCTVEEIEAAKKNPQNFIKKAQGVDLYLSVYLKAKAA